MDGEELAASEKLLAQLKICNEQIAGSEKEKDGLNQRLKAAARARSKVRERKEKKETP